MRILFFLLQKEFRQIFRNPNILRIILIVPIIQLLILPLAADFEIKNITIAVVDKDHSSYSERLTHKITSSGYFLLSCVDNTYPQAFENLEKDKADIVLEIPKDFEKNLEKENRQPLFIAVNAINGIKGGVGASYLASIISDFSFDIRQEVFPMPEINPVPQISVDPVNWFNIYLNYHYYMVPAILVILVTMVGSYMCALNIVKEKEVGTIEQINVTPVKKYQFVLGKLIPFWIIGMFIFTIGLFGIARFVYSIVPVGNIFLLYSFLSLYLIALLGLGLLISTYSNTQQQAMSLAFFFMMIFILMSGLFTPIDSMPEWAKWIARLNPVTYFIEVVRMVVLKGSGFRDISLHFVVMTGFAIVFNTWAILNYKKQA